MGYESKIYIGYTHESSLIGYWLYDVACVDIGSHGYDEPTHFLDLFPKDPDPTNQISLFDHNDEQITEDKYGNLLSMVPATDALEALKKDCKSKRFSWAIKLLEAMVEEDRDDLVVVNFGF